MSMMVMMLAAGAGAIEFQAEFLVIGGGGDHGNDFSAGRTDTAGGGGGGAGGYISSVSGESSGGGASALTPPTLTTGVTYSVTVGAAASNTIFSGTDVGGTSFNHTALAGGTRNTTGGSGGGSAYSDPNNGGTFSPGSGTTGQGYGGSNANYPTGSNAGVCDTPRFMCYSDSDSATFCGTGYPGAGGGAGGAASGRNGGVGVQSSITGTATYYAGGGASETICLTNNYNQGTPGSGSTNYGGGGSYAETGQPGVVILRYSNAVTISNPGGGLTMSTSAVGSNNVTTITAGSGNIEFA